MRTLIAWLTDSSWGDDDHVPAAQCPWRKLGHSTMLLSHRPPRRPWRRLYELRCISCDLIVELPPPRLRYDSLRRWRAAWGSRAPRSQG